MAEEEPEYVSVEVIRADALYPIDVINRPADEMEGYPVGYRMRVERDHAMDLVARGVARIAEDN